MKFHAHFRRTLAGMVLLSGSASVGAVPVFTAGTMAPPAPAAAKPTTCAATLAVVMVDHDGAHVIGRTLDTRAVPDWFGSKVASLSSHTALVLLGKETADLDGLDSPCRLDDSEHTKDARLNAGEDVTELMAQIDEWLEMKRHRGQDESGQGNAIVTSVLDQEPDGDQRQWQALLISGQALQEPASMSGLAPLLPFDDGYSMVLRSRLDGGLPGNAPHGGLAGLSADGNGGTSTAAAVPEPASWAALLGGLALLGWYTRRRSSTLKA